MRYVPVTGLLMASPVVLDAVQGRGDVLDALVVWLVAMLLAVGGVMLFRAATATTPGPPPRPPQPSAPRRRAGDVA